MEIYLCDDNEIDRRRLLMELERYAQRRFSALKLRSFESGEALLSAWETAAERPALVFLDIYMEGLDGMELARQLRQTDQTIPLIFTTSSTEHGIAAFEVFARGYLKKPYTTEQLSAVLEALEPMLLREARGISVRVRRENRCLPLYQILYLETDGHNTLIHTDSETFRSSAAIGSFRERLAGEPAFMECGKSYLVNLYAVKSWAGNTITMRGGSEVYMPQRLMAALKKYMEDFLYGDGVSL